MIWLITGGSGSGKSEYAEKLACRLAEEKMKTQQEPARKLYLATMQSDGAEARERIARHRKLRQGKGFVTVEAPYGPESEETYDIILLECVSNLTANLMFGKGMSADETAEEILRQVKCLSEMCPQVVVVSNEVFADGVLYDRETMEYMRGIGLVNRKLSQIAEYVCEVIYSIPMYVKGEDPCIS